MPVLAKQAIERAGFVEDGKVLVAIFRSGSVSILRITSPCPGGTNEVGDTVGRQRVVIPTDDGGSLPVTMWQTAIANPTLRNSATLRANRARNSFRISRWLLWKPKVSP
jgi:hypothetical protein